MEICKMVHQMELGSTSQEKKVQTLPQLLPNGLMLLVKSS